jgi:hypothetical protein
MLQFTFINLKLQQWIALGYIPKKGCIIIAWVMFGDGV